MTKIHQSQLRPFHDYWLIASQTDFSSWLDHHVGEFNRDWGRTYNLDKSHPDYGCSWWFRDPKMVTLTLLKWS